MARAKLTIRRITRRVRKTGKGSPYVRCPKCGGTGRIKK